MVGAKKILILGNLGYVGPELVKHLRAKNPAATLIGYDIGYFSNLLTTQLLSPERNLDAQYYGDIRDFDTSILNGVDAVVALAAISNDPIGNKFEQVTMDVNCNAIVKIANSAKESGVKTFVFASSCSVYGFADDQPRTENSSLNPLTAYAKSKVKAEEMLEKCADKNFQVSCLRFATACGMSDRLRLDLVLNDFVASAVFEKKINILSDGSPWRPLINVRDMALAIEWATSRTGDNFIVVNTGSNDWNYTVLQLAEKVLEFFPEVNISVNKNAAPDKRSYKVNFDLYNKLAANYLPQFDLTKTIQDLKDGIGKITTVGSDFRNSNLIRLNVINSLLQQGSIDEQLCYKK